MKGARLSQLLLSDLQDLSRFHGLLVTPSSGHVSKSQWTFPCWSNTAKRHVAKSVLSDRRGHAIVEPVGFAPIAHLRIHCAEKCVGKLHRLRIHSLADILAQ